MKKEKSRRGGWSGGPLPATSNKLVWWGLAIGFTAIAVATAVIWHS